MGSTKTSKKVTKKKAQKKPVKVLSRNEARSALAHQIAGRK
jgi:hypothetical protein